MKKLCGKCKRVLLLSEFYRHGRDGWQAHCKECKRGENRLYNRTPARRIYNKKIYKTMQKEGYFKFYYQRPEVKIRKAMQMRQYRKNPQTHIKNLARWAVNRALNKGLLTKKACAICGIDKSEAHHKDYLKPFLVVWLCRSCHRTTHAKAESK